MSKTYEELKRLQEMRTHKYSLAVEKATPNNTKRAFSVFLTAFIIAITIINLALLFTLHSYASNKNAFTKKIAFLESLTSTNSKATKEISESLKVVTRNLKDIKANLKELSATTDSQASAIDNLTKAKNTLFNRVSTLEAQAGK